jgi:type I restriction enzyme S subunit
VQEAIAGQEALIAKLKELKRSMMHHLFTHGTRGEKTKITEIGEIPESWEVVRIKFFGQIITGTTPSTKVPDYYGGPYKLVSPADLTDNLYIETSQKTLTEAGLNAARKVPKNSVLVGCIGNVGKIGITHDEVTAFNQQINAIVVNDRFDFLFVYYLIYFYRHVLESKASKVTVPILNKSNFENIELAAPELKEQIRIAQALYSVDRKIEFIKMKLSVYQNLFKTLLHELMSGGRRIKFYEKEIK